MLKNKYEKTKKRLQEINATKIGYPTTYSDLYLKYNDTNVEVAHNMKEGYEPLLNYEVFGINTNSVACLSINNAGNPFDKEKSSYLLNCKEFEVEIINMLSKFFGLSEKDGFGYVTSGGTESNFVSLWWSKKFLANNKKGQITFWNKKLTILKIII